jgi:hypothetical protein
VAMAVMTAMTAKKAKNTLAHRLITVGLPAPLISDILWSMLPAEPVAPRSGVSRLLISITPDSPNVKTRSGR